MPPITASRVSGFAFDTSPNVVTSSGTGLFTKSVVGGSYPNGVGAVELCFNSGNSCQGGGNGGVDIGPQGTGSFSLTLAAPSPTLTFDQFYVRYKSIAGTTLGNSGTGVQVNTPVPEPATWGMMILGFGIVSIVGSAARRRRSLAIA